MLEVKNYTQHLLESGVDQGTAVVVVEKHAEKLHTFEDLRDDVLRFEGHQRSENPDLRPLYARKDGTLFRAVRYESGKVGLHSLEEGSSQWNRARWSLESAELGWGNKSARLLETKGKSGDLFPLERVRY